MCWVDCVLGGLAILVVVGEKGRREFSLLERLGPRTRKLHVSVLVWEHSL